MSDRLIFLGTKGGPSLRGAARLPSANALVVDGVPFVLDTGYGASLRRSPTPTGSPPRARTTPAGSSSRAT